MKAYVIINWVELPGYINPIPEFDGISLSKAAAEEEIEKYRIAWENAGYHRSVCPVRIIEVELSNKVFIPVFDDDEDEEDY